MQNKVMSMRRTALKLLIAKHRAEHKRLQEDIKERLRKDEPFLTTEGRRTRARNMAESEIVQIHYAEFREIHDQVKMLEGRLWGIDLFTHNIRELWASGRTREQIITRTMEWPGAYARQMLRRKYPEEYKAIIRNKATDFPKSTLYTHSSTELIHRHRRDYDRFRQQCRTAIVNLLNELERENDRVTG